MQEHAFACQRSANARKAGKATHMLLLLILCALIGLATPARATDWYIYHAGKQLCVEAVSVGPPFVSPAALEQYWRATSQFKNRDIA
jgi:hypothetical protein